jgi:hypothetical protein
MMPALATQRIPAFSSKVALVVFSLVSKYPSHAGRLLKLVDFSEKSSTKIAVAQEDRQLPSNGDNWTIEELRAYYNHTKRTKDDLKRILKNRHMDPAANSTKTQLVDSVMLLHERETGPHRRLDL